MQRWPASALLLTPQGFDPKHATVGPWQSHGMHSLTTRAKHRHIIPGHCAPTAATLDGGGIINSRERAGTKARQRSIADFSMLLADPAVTHLLALEVVRRLYGLVGGGGTSEDSEHQKLPRDDDALPALLQLLEFAGSAFAAARDEAAATVPPVPGPALTCLLPVLAGVIVDGNAARVRLRPPCYPPCDPLAAAVAAAAAYAAAAAARGCLKRLYGGGGAASARPRGADAVSDN